MELQKKYPWTQQLKIPAEKLEEWKNTNPSPSLTIWSLKNQLIDKRQYIQWAVDHYQIPLVKDLFFQEYVMVKEHWDEVKEKYNWTEEIFPIAIWNKTLFLGCVEPPSKEIQISDFDVRLVLVNQPSLENRWHFIQKFLNPPSHKQRIFKDETQNTNYKLKQSAEPRLKVTHKEEPQAKANPAVKASFEPDLPVEKPRTPLKLMPSLQKPEDLQKPTPQKTDLEKPPIRPSIFKDESPSLQKPEGLKKPEQVAQILKQSLKPKPINSVDSKDQPPASDSDNLTTSTSFSILCTQKGYDDLWKYAQSYYSASLILELQDDGKVFISSWNGRVDVSNDQLSVDLNAGPSLFKVVQKGMTYNGYVIDNAFHKKFFNQLGWSEYPKHLTAIPIKDSHKLIKQVFMGLSTKTFSLGELKNIESRILKFFDSKSPQLKVA